MNSKYKTIIKISLHASVSSIIWVIFGWFLTYAKEQYPDIGWVLEVRNLSVVIMPSVIVVTSILVWRMMGTKVLLISNFVYMFLLGIIGLLWSRTMSFENGLAILIELILTYEVVGIWTVILILLILVRFLFKERKNKSA